MHNDARDDSTGWRHVATIEIGEDIPDFRKLVDDSAIRFRAEASQRSPRGYQWFDFYVDAKASAREAARIAWALLWNLKRLHETGQLHDFRIIHGQQYLDIGDSNAAMGIDGMTRENLADK
jgi:hypothetical protein